MKKNNISKYFILLFYLLLQIISFAYWKGLGQSNQENLFFSQSGLQNYEQFLKNFEEAKLLLVKINYPSDLNEFEYTKFKTAIQNLRNEYPDIEILTFFDLYQHAVHEDSPKAFLKFLQEKNEISPKLVSPNSLIFFSIFNPQSTSQSIASFISKLQTPDIFGAQKIQMAGLPYINTLLDQYSRDINTQLFPLLFLVVFLILFIFTRNFISSLILFIPALSSLSVSMVLIKALYSSMNMVTSIVPLLIFVLNLSLALHFYYAFLEYASMKRALKEKRAPFLLMVSATAIAFGSLALSDIPAIRQFGILSFPAILLSSTLTLLWATIVFPWRIKNNNQDSLKWIPTSLFSKTWRIPTIIIICVLLIPTSFFVFPKIKINTDATTYFPKKSGLEKNIRDLENEMSGFPVLEIDLSKKDKTNLEYDDLLEVDKMESSILQEFAGQRKILSANQLVKDANYLYTGEKKLPLFDISYWALKSQIVPAIQNQYPSGDHYRITFLGPSMNAKDYGAELSRIQKIVDRSPQFNAAFSGLYYQILHSQSSLIWILTLSFIFRFLVMAFLFYLYFRRLKLLFIFLIANEVPMFACILFLYLFRFSLNVATVMVFPVAIGIVVGNILHVLYALNKKPLPSFEEYKRTIVFPILMGSTTLIVGFSILGFYGFLPIQQFGAALAFTIFVGLFSAVYLVPTLILKSSHLKQMLNEAKNNS